MDRVGFTLIEFVAYLACSTILALGIFIWVAQISRDAVRLRQKIQQSLYAHFVRDVVRQDLEGASAQLNDYDDTMNVFKKYWLDDRGRPCEAWIAYEANKKGLARVHGVFDRHLKIWNKRVVSYLPPCFDMIEIKPHVNHRQAVIEVVTVVYHIDQVSEPIIDQCIIKNGIV